MLYLLDVVGADQHYRGLGQILPVLLTKRQVDVREVNRQATAIVRTAVEEILEDFIEHGLGCFGYAGVADD